MNPPPHPPLICVCVCVCFPAPGVGVVTTVAVPVVQGNVLLGVAGVDVTLASMLARVDFADLGPSSYAFVIDAKGRAIMHPLLPLPATLSDDPVFLDIAELETATGFAAVRTAMLNDATGSTSLLVDRALPRGDGVQEGVRITTGTYTYEYGPLAGSPFKLCLVLAQDDETKSEVATVAFPGAQVYHRVDVSGDKECNHFTQTATKDHSTYKFSPSSFQDPAAHIALEPSAAEVQAFQGVVDSTSPGATLPVGLQLADAAFSRKDVWKTAGMDTHWVGGCWG